DLESLRGQPDGVGPRPAAQLDHPTRADVPLGQDTPQFGRGPPGVPGERPGLILRVPVPGIKHGGGHCCPFHSQVGGQGPEKIGHPGHAPGFASWAVPRTATYNSPARPARKVLTAKRMPGKEKRREQIDLRRDSPMTTPARPHRSRAWFDTPELYGWLRRS